MDIEEVHIGMKLRNPACARVGNAICIEKEGGLLLEGYGGITWNEHVENVEPVGGFAVGDLVKAIGPSIYGVPIAGKRFTVRDPHYESCSDGIVVNVGPCLVKPENLVKVVEPAGEFQVGDRVRQIGQSVNGYTDNMDQRGIIVQEYTSGAFGVTWDNGNRNVMPPTSIEPVEQIHPAIHIEDFRSLAEVAKCYVQVAPEKLFLSQDAKRMIEYLTAMDTPVAFWRISEGMKDMVSGAAIIDGLIEAREAGLIRLDDGKYSLVRD